ncbi:MAG: thioredoxin family protein, partial [Actinomycetota bacterium]|nr:thioredoxin family protein [Actinomycetota bacterium]
IAESLRAHVPFVVTFATPRYCSSRTCGPVVDVVDQIRRRFANRAIRFIHVEIYQDNDPRKGENRWVREWRLPSEPWTFLVGRDGRIKGKFEGSVSVRELESAVRDLLQ